jgi:long-chain fatty acid transport protein
MLGKLEGSQRTFRALHWGAAVLSLLAAATAHAGGYDTGERDWDFLFQQDRFAFEAGTTYVDPQRKLKNVSTTAFPGTTASVEETDAFAVARLSVAARLGENARCMGSYREPWAGHADYGSSWVGAPSAITQDFSSTDLGLTCALATSLGPGDFHLLAGVSYQEISYELTQSEGIAGIRSTSVSDGSIGWRAGLAYEIPEYALRTSLIYNSEIDYDMTGTVESALFSSTTPVFGSISMPQSVELRAASGIAPNWLAFGAVKWTDWSVDQNMPLCASGTPTCTQAGAVSGLTLLWKDTWTVTIGAAHRLTQLVSLAADITWDQGASEGFTSQTDTWTTGLTAVITPNEHFTIRVGGTVGVMTGGSLSTAVLPGGIPNPVGYTASFDEDLVYAVRAAMALRF